MTSDEKLLVADTAARTAALDVERSFIVQAPAGSGKTELLIQRYLRLLGSVEQPEEVLAITFTRKAAAEMQVRVLRALQRAAQKDRPEQPHEQITYEAARAVLQVDGKRGWRLVENPQRLRIQTLDSLNASIVRAQPLAGSGSTAYSAIASEARTKRLYSEAALLTLDQLLETGRSRDATELVLGHVDGNTDRYVDYLSRMLATRDQWLPFIGTGILDAREAQELRRQLEANLELVVSQHLAQLHDLFPQALEEELLAIAREAATILRQTGRHEHVIAALLDLDAKPGAGGDHLEQWLGIAELLLTTTGALRKTVNKTQGLPGGSKPRAAMLELLPRFAEHARFCARLHEVRHLPPVRYTDEQWSVLLALFRLLPIAVTELKRLFATQGTTDYTEVALDAAAALGSAEEPGDIALLLDYQLRHLLVDEMQDTSSAQYRMLEALTGGWEPGDGRTLFCVGDPMQSIYRFRNAEVGQFLVARTSGIGTVELEPLTLRRNFRSGSVLVDWFNANFPAILAEEEDPARGAVAYAEAVAAGMGEDGGAWHVYPVFGADPETEAGQACRVIADLLNADPEGDVAVLVRGRTRLPELLRRLQAAGIAYQAVDIDRLTDLPEIIDLLALTRALVHRSDRLAWLALLRSPWAGLHWQDLHALVSGARESTVWELLQDDDRLATLSSAGRRLAIRLRDSLADELLPQPDESLRDRVERVWLSLGGPAIASAVHEVENAYRFLDVLEGMESGGTIGDVAELENLLDLERVSSSSQSRLQVMTMHRAKGLQFDHVVLYGLGRTAAGNERSVLSWVDIPAGHGDNETLIGPVGARAEVDNDPIHRFIERTLAARDREETARLLYVACTRACRSLHLVGHTALNKDGSDYRPPRSDSLLALLWPAVQGEFARAFEKTEPPGPADDSATWSLPALNRLASDWILPVPEELPQAHEADELPSEEAVDFDWVGAGARHAGTVIHRWLQLAGAGEVDIDDLDNDRVTAVSERWFLEAGVAANLLPSVQRRVRVALETVRRDPRGRWILAGDGCVELGLTGVYRGRLESVILDRVRIDADGNHWIIDYKTGSHEGGGLDAFLAAEAERYRPQLDKYRFLYGAMSGAPVRCALYFPLLGAFVEVPDAAAQEPAID